MEQLSVGRGFAATVVVVVAAGCSAASQAPTPAVTIPATTATPAAQASVPATALPAATPTGPELATPGSGATAPPTDNAASVQPTVAPGEELAFRPLEEFPAMDAFEVTSVTATSTGFVAVGFGPMPGEGYFDRRRALVWTSSDGVSWTMQTPDPAIELLTPEQVIVLGEALYMIGLVASCPQIIEDECAETPDAGNSVWRSTNGGASWERLAVPQSLQQGVIDGATVARDRLVIFGGAGDDLITTMWLSSDGVSWTETADLAGLDPVSAVAATPTGLVAFGTQFVEELETPRLVAATSTDGVLWQPLDVPDVPTASIDDMATGEAGLAAVGYGQADDLALSGIALHSADGTSWSPAQVVDGSFEGAALNAVHPVGSGFVAIGYGPQPDDPELNNGRVWTSADGMSWQQAASLAGSLTQFSASSLGEGGLVLFTADHEEFDDGSVDTTIGAWFAPREAVTPR